jgi:Fe-S-cluster containining protein
MDRKSPSGRAKCATLGKTCRRSREILVTAGEKDRIAAFTGERGFWERAYPADLDYLEEDDDPNWLKWAFRADGSRPILKRQPNGDCRFLSGTGCTLPVETRPLVCRLYPYVCAERRIDGVSDDGPREVVRPGQTILRVLDRRMTDAVGWHRML